MRTQRRSGGGGGFERYVLALALLVPLFIGLLALLELPGIRVSVPSTMVYADSGPMPLVAKRPVSSQAGPPPTLVAPTTTAKPTAASPRPSPTAVAERTYTVKPGDELKQIAASYGVSIWKMIEANEIADPDSLNVGQVLKIPNS